MECGRWKVCFDPQLYIARTGSFCQIHSQIYTHKCVCTEACIHATTTSQCKLQSTSVCLCTLVCKQASWHRKNTTSANNLHQLMTELVRVVQTAIQLLHPAPTSPQNGLDPLQLVLVVFFFHQLVQILTCTCGGHHLQLALVVFFHANWPIFIQMCTNWCVQQLASCGPCSGGSMYTCVCACTCVCVCARTQYCVAVVYK